MVKHWLHGEIELKVPTEKDTECHKCVHAPVCRHDMNSFCLNYTFGTSTEDMRTCHSCVLRFTRYDSRQPIPCFSCKHYRN